MSTDQISQANRWAQVRESCGDGSSCPSGTTCCDIGSGQYGCCPIPDAVCCSDKLHCCPQGMICDTTHSMCTNGYIRQPFHQKMKTERQVESDSWESNSIEDETEEEKVENGSEECKGKSQVPMSGAYNLLFVKRKNHRLLSDGRCRFIEKQVNKTICEFQCVARMVFTAVRLIIVAISKKKLVNQQAKMRSANRNRGTKSLASTQIVRKKGVKYQPSLQECSNGDTCNGQSTCCHNTDDNEAYCCAYSNGKCCRNGKKCCSEGFTCSEYGDECVREENGGEFNDRPNQKCPDGTRCSPLNTCCPIRSHLDGGIIGYQCCELTNGVCCKDHCCPRGHRCSTDGRCEKSVLNKRINWYN
ncbi:Granulin [Aphelenchoides besseyi]|nr:Granulin [Aphelenchoides besseyi]